MARPKRPVLPDNCIRAAERICDEVPMLKVWIEKNTEPKPGIFRRSYSPRGRLVRALAEIITKEVATDA
jgi:hypothetical protein